MALVALLLLEVTRVAAAARTKPEALVEWKLAAQMVRALEAQLAVGRPPAMNPSPPKMWQLGSTRVGTRSWATTSKIAKLGCWTM
jgi:hypothetical protein